MYMYVARRMRPRFVRRDMTQCLELVNQTGRLLFVVYFMLKWFSQTNNTLRL